MYPPSQLIIMHQATEASAMRQRLEHAKLRKRVEFRTAPASRHRHAEHTGGLQRFHNRCRQAARSLDLVGGCADLGSHCDGGVQNGRVGRLCLARGIRHQWNSIQVIVLI